jgi:hypothetical protein
LDDDDTDEDEDYGEEIEVDPVTPIPDPDRCMTISFIILFVHIQLILHFCRLSTRCSQAMGWHCPVRSKDGKPSKFYLIFLILFV